MEESIDMNEYNLLPTIDESLGDERNISPKRAYGKKEYYVDALGYQRFTDNDFYVLNSDGSIRKAPGANKKLSSKVKMTRVERRAQRQFNLVASKAELKQRDLLKRLSTENFDVIAEAIDLFDGADTSDDLKWRILAKLIDHSFPKLSVLNTNEAQTDGFVFNFHGAVPIKKGTTKKEIKALTEGLQKKQ